MEIKRNVIDIEQVVKDFCKKYKEAETLHVHYSGKIVLTVLGQ